MSLFQKPAIGLDISDHSIEAVLILVKGGRYVLSSYGRTTLPPGLVVNGSVQRRDELGVILRKLLTDQMKPPLPRGLNRIAFALPESQIFSHIFEVPRVADDGELGRSLAFEADGYFPYNHQELVSGYVIIGQRPDKKEIFYGAVHQNVLKGFLSLFSVSNLAPAVIEAESTSIARAVLPMNEPDPVVLVDIGARVTDLSIFDRNGIQFSEALETAGDAFTAALIRAMGITQEDAESLKKSQGVAGDLDLKAQKALKNELDRLVGDIREAIFFYERRSKRVVERVLLCGGSSLMPGLPEYVAERLPAGERGFHVELADPWQDLEVDPLLEKLGIRARGVLITTAIGLALRGAGVRKFSEVDFRPGAAGLLAERRSGARLPAAPAFRRLPLWIKAGIGVLAFLLLMAGAWYATFVIYPRWSAKKPQVEPGAAAAGMPIEVEITLGAAFSDEKDLVRVVPIEVERIVEESFAHAAVPVDGFARGTVRLVNTTGTAQTLVARTRLLSAGGELFRLDAPARVPAGGGVTAAVTADQAGAAGNVGPGRFTIPGLTASLQTQIYGESQEAMTGGVAYDGTPLSADELEANKKAIVQQIEESLYEAAAEKAGTEYVAIRGLFTVTGADVLAGPEAGQPTGDYKLAVRVRGKILAFTADEIGKILTKKLAALLPAGAAANAYAIEGIGYRVVAASPSENGGRMVVTANAVRRE